MKINDFLCFAVYSASHGFNRLYKQLLRDLKLTYPQYLVMVALWSDGSQTVNSLGEKLDLESNTLTPLLKRLEAMGLLTRTRDTADERQVLIALTDSGRATRERALNIPGCVASATGLAAPDLAKLTSDMIALRNAIEAYAGNASPSSSKSKPTSLKVP